MRKIYSATFDIGVAAAPLITAVLEELRDWVTSKARRKEIQFAPPLRHDFLSTGSSVDGARRVETLRWGSKETGGWALRWIQPTGAAAEPDIISELVLRQASDRLNFSIHIGYQRDVPRAPTTLTTRPRIVPTLISKFGATWGLALSVKPQTVSESETGDLLDVLRNPDRRLPVVLFSVDAERDRCICSTDLVADLVAGLAHVYQLEDVAASFALTDRLGKEHSCYNGCARLYWPAWTPGDNPFRHMLLWPEELEPDPPTNEYRGANRVLHVVATAATALPHERPEDFLDAQLAVVRAEHGELYELLDLYDSDINEKRAELQRLSEELTDLQSKCTSLEKRKTPRIRVAVCMGSAADAHRPAAWERRFEQLAEHDGVTVERDYFHGGDLPSEGYDIWILDEKTVAGHKEYKHDFPGKAKEAGAKWLSVRNPTQVSVISPQLVRS